MFYSFTGCDTASTITRQGNKTAWECFPDVTDVFHHLSKQPDTLSENNPTVLERFVILMYSKTCDIETE